MLVEWTVWFLFHGQLPLYLSCATTGAPRLRPFNEGIPPGAAGPGPNREAQQRTSAPAPTRHRNAPVRQNELSFCSKPTPPRRPRHQTQGPRPRHRQNFLGIVAQFRPLDGCERAFLKAIRAWWDDCGHERADSATTCPKRSDFSNVGTLARQLRAHERPEGVKPASTPEILSVCSFLIHDRVAKSFNLV